jgi:CheY-like chemotaxis protein
MSLILIIDDNPDHRMIYRIWLEAAGYAVIEASDGAEGVQKIIIERPDCILVDYMIGAEDGFVLIHQTVRDLPECPPMILLTCALTEALDRNSIAVGAFACFDKSTLERKDLFAAIDNAIREKNGRH